MSKDKDISKKIKDSFDKESYKAPTFKSFMESNDHKIDEKVKQSVEQNIEKAPSFSSLFMAKDNLIDKKIKESFDEQRYVLPNSIWNNIENQLDVSKVWSRLSGQIKINTFSISRLAVAASLLFLMIFTPFKLSDGVVFNQLYHSDDSKIINQNSSFETNNLTHISEVETKEKQDAIMIDVKSKQNKQDKIFYNDGKMTSINEVNMLSSFEDKIFSPHQKIELIKLTTYPLSVKVELQPKQILDFNSVDKKSNTKVRAGFFVSVNSSFLNDKETRSTFGANSLSSFKPTVTFSKGLVLDYLINDRYSMSAYYLFQSNSKSKIGYYNDNGFYTYKTKEIIYSKLAVLFNFNLKPKIRHPNLRSVIGVGPYLSVNKGSSITQGDVITSFNSSYKKHDYGLKVILGKNIQIDNLLLEGGVTSEVGFRNILNSSNSFANNLNLGLYFNVKYNLH